MAPVFVWVALSLMAFHCSWTEASVQLQVGEGTEHNSERSEPLSPEDISERSETISPDDISNLMSDIESAFRFLEEQPVEPQVTSRTEDAHRYRKNEKINRLPFTQHNFIRFGKRFQSSQEAQTMPLLSMSAGPENLSGNLQEILTRLKDANSVPSGNPLSESSSVFWNSEQNSSPDMNSDKRQLHNFVRFGKRSPENDNFGKRQLHNFVRFGRNYIPTQNVPSLEETDDSSNIELY
uniref:FaRP-B n=1 Tax=Ambigolimax valentianus TaxID=1338344 RepID=A0A2Z6C4B7_9EUPU|nr:FaRP-B [Ambigolimax valentianus]